MTNRRSVKLDSVLYRALRLSSSDLKSKVVGGSKFQFAGILVRTFLTIASTAVLARLLTPADFGYVAMAMVVTEFAALLGNFGFSAVLIQKQRINRLQADTVFWVSLAFGLLPCLVVVAASVFAPVVFGAPQLQALLPVMSLMFVLSSLTAVPSALMSRLMMFRAEFIVSSLSAAVRAASAIVFAWLGYGLWSLVLGSIIGAVAQVACSFVAAPFWPRARFSVLHLRQTWRTSGSYFGGGLLSFVNANVDVLLIGRSLGATALGYYQNARSLTDEIRTRIAGPVQQVLFPAFSALQSDRPRMQTAVKRSCSLLAAVTVPLGVGVSAMADELVPLLYGQQWLPMIPIVSLLGLGASVRASTAVVWPLLNAMNRVGLALRYNVVGSGLFIIAICVALPFGIEAVALAALMVSPYTLIPFAAALRLLDMKPGVLWQILAAPVVASAVAWLAIYLARPHLAAVVPSGVGLLLVHAVLGAGVYLTILHAWSREYINELRQLMASRAGAK